MNLSFDFSPALVDPRTEKVHVPISGQTPQSRHASWTGAKVVEKTWTERQSTILQLLAGGPKSRQELSGLTGLPINSVCSCVGNLLNRQVIESNGDFDVHVDGNGETTKRERLRVKR